MTRSYVHAITQQTIDAGYSGQVTVTAAAGNPYTEPMVFVESDLLASVYLLTAGQARELADALTAAAAAVQRRSLQLVGSDDRS